MALEIPVIRSQTSVPSVALPLPQPAPSPVAVALDEAARQFAGIVAEQERVREEQRRATEAAWVTQATADAELQWRRQLATDSDAVPTGQATGFADRFTAGFGEWMEGQLATAPSDEARLALQDRFLSLRNNLYASAASWENQTVVAEQGARFDGAFDATAQLAAQSGDIDAALASFGRDLSIADAAWMDGPSVEKWKVEGPARLRAAWLDGLIARSPEEAAIALGMQPAALQGPAIAGGGATQPELAAVEWAESGGNPGAVSSAGAVGIMQVMPGTAREMAFELGLTDVAQMSDEALVDWLKVADNNRLVGGRYLDRMLRKYGGNRTLAFAAYNAGPGAVDGWLARIGDPRSGAVTDAQFAAAIPYDETRAYVGKLIGRLGPGSGGTLVAQDAGTLHPAVAALPVETVSAARAQVERALAEDRAQLAAVLDARIADESAAVLAGAPVAQPVTYGETVEAYGPVEGPAIWQALEDDRRFGRDLGTIALMTPDRQNGLLAQYAPEGEGFEFEAQRYQELARAIAADREAREDPARYVLQHSPDLQAMYAAATDPALDVGAQGKAFAAFLDTSLRLQERAGIAEPRLLSTAQAAEVVARIRDPRPEPGQQGRSAAETMADAMQGQAILFGRHWSQAYRELADAGLPPEFVVLATMEDPRARVMLGEAFMADPTQLKAAIGTDAAKTVDDAVTAALADFERTFLYSPNGIAESAAYVDAATRLAYVYARRHDPREAARLAADAVANGARRYMDEPGYLARVPHPWGLDAVRYTAESALAALEADRLVDPGASSGATAALTPEQRREAYLDSIRQSHLWITNEDESGLYLLDGAGNPVFRADGTRIDIRFDGLLSRPPLPIGSAVP